jgi:hypothetical protein
MTSGEFERLLTRLGDEHFVVLVGDDEDAVIHSYIAVCGETAPWFVRTMLALAAEITKQFPDEVLPEIESDIHESLLRMQGEGMVLQ